MVPGLSAIILPSRIYQLKARTILTVLTERRCQAYLPYLDNGPDHHKRYNVHGGDINDVYHHHDIIGVGPMIYSIKSIYVAVSADTTINRLPESSREPI